MVACGSGCKAVEDDGADPGKPPPPQCGPHTGSCRTLSAGEAAQPASEANHPGGAAFSVRSAHRCSEQSRSPSALSFSPRPINVLHLCRCCLEHRSVKNPSALFPFSRGHASCLVRFGCPELAWFFRFEIPLSAKHIINPMLMLQEIWRIPGHSLRRPGINCGSRDCAHRDKEEVAGR